MKKKLSVRELHQIDSLNQLGQDNQSGALLGIDYGEKYCGLAWSPDGVVVFPLRVVPRAETATEIERILNEKQIQTLVFGLPLGSKNEENHICAQVRAFADLFKQSGRTIHFQNEQFSSQAVMGTANRIDHWAAAKILEYWIARK
ncbi:hypothetical protein CSB37_01330 [bacterium DOLZORAL124_38_8]|nr:MAG: hypothetical protein CSB37_01330 [bacterium DOLZORAL124_38_8]